MRKLNVFLAIFVSLVLGVAVFELFGSLFFGAVGKIESLPQQLPAGTRAVVLEMHRLISIDTSGIDALQQLYRTLRRRDVALVLANVNEQPLGLIKRSGFADEIGAEQIVPSVAELWREPPVVEAMPASTTPSAASASPPDR